MNATVFDEDFPLGVPENVTYSWVCFHESDVLQEPHSIDLSSIPEVSPPRKNSKVNLVTDKTDLSAD